VERDLDPHDAGEHCHGSAPKHRARGRASVLSHRERRSDQHREHEQRAEPLDRDGHGGCQQHEEYQANERGTEPRGGRTPGVEGHRGQRAVQGEQREAAQAEQRGGRDEIAFGHPQRVAEEQLLEALRRVWRQREQRAEADQTRDRHGGARVRADARVASGERDQRGGRERAARGAKQDRGARERGDHEAGQEPVGERLRAVGEALRKDPEPERTAESAHKRQLEQCTTVDARAQRVDHEVEHVHVSDRARARGAGR